MSRAFRLTPPKPKVSENDVESGCLALLLRRNYKAFRLHAGRFRSLDYGRIITGVPKGTPDYAIEHEFYPGFLLETKRPEGTPSPEQELRIFELRQGYRLAVCIAASPVELEAWLEQHELKARARWKQLLG